MRLTWDTAPAALSPAIWTRDDAEDLARAVLEATAFQTREVVEAMEQDSGITLEVLRVDGGMVDNGLLMQFQADILNRPVVKPLIKETTSLGAAYAAGLAVGFYKYTDELRARWSVGQTWNPSLEESKCAEMYRMWKKSGDPLFDWIEYISHKGFKERRTQRYTEEYRFGFPLWIFLRPLWLKHLQLFSSRPLPP